MVYYTYHPQYQITQYIYTHIFINHLQIEFLKYHGNPFRKSALAKLHLLHFHPRLVQECAFHRRLRRQRLAALARRPRRRRFHGRGGDRRKALEAKFLGSGGAPVMWMLVYKPHEYYLVGGWKTILKKYMSSSIGRVTSHILWKIKNVPNHQPDTIVRYIHKP